MDMHTKPDFNAGGASLNIHALVIKYTEAVSHKTYFQK